MHAAILQHPVVDESLELGKRNFRRGTKSKKPEMEKHKLKRKYLNSSENIY